MPSSRETPKRRSGATPRMACTGCPGNNLVSGNYRGRAAILSHQIKLMELTGGTMRLTLDDLIAEDAHACCSGT